mgnify:CR=1 FL=1
MAYLRSGFLKDGLLNQTDLGKMGLQKREVIPAQGSKQQVCGSIQSPHISK